MNGNSVIVNNYIGGKFVPPSTGDYLDVNNPADFHIIGKVGISNTSDVQDAVAAAEKAFPSWSNMTIKARAAIVSSYLIVSTVRDGPWYAFLLTKNRSSLFSFFR